MIRINHIYNERVENFLPKMPDNMVDMVIADPPFNLKKQYEDYEDDMPIEEYYGWVENWVRASVQKLKNHGTLWVYCPTKHLGRFQVIGQKYGIWQNTVVWFYSNPTPSQKRLPKTWSAWLVFSKTDNFQFFKDAETVKSFQTGKPANVYDVWYDISKLTGGYLAQKEVILKPGTKKREAVYQLPVRLLSRIIKLCSKEGDLILDLFSHSGTASYTADFLKRKYIAVEQSPYYCAIIKKRMDEIRLL